MLSRFDLQVQELDRHGTRDKALVQLRTVKPLPCSLGPTKVINALYDNESGHDVCFIIYLPSKRLMTILLQHNLIANDGPRFL